MFFNAETEVDCPSSLVYGFIEVSPLALNLDMGFVNSPGPSVGFSEAVPVLDKLWSELPKPTHDCRMSYVQSTFGHQLD